MQKYRAADSFLKLSPYVSLEALLCFYSRHHEDFPSELNRMILEIEGFARGIDGSQF